MCKAIYCKRTYLSNWNILSMENLSLLPGYWGPEEAAAFIGI